TPSAGVSGWFPLRSPRGCRRPHRSGHRCAEAWSHQARLTRHCLPLPRTGDGNTTHPGNRSGSLAATLCEETLATTRRAAGVPMMSDDSVRFWQPTPQAATELACAYLEVGWVRPHVHEEWQFAVSERPSKLSVGAFRRYPAGATDITVVAPYAVHTEGGAAGPPARWRVLYVAPSIISEVCRGLAETAACGAPGLSGAVLADPAGAAELGALLRASEDGKIDGSEFLARALRWLEQLLR